MPVDPVQDWMTDGQIQVSRPRYEAEKFSDSSESSEEGDFQINQFDGIDDYLLEEIGDIGELVDDFGKMEPPTDVGQGALHNDIVYHDTLDDSFSSDEVEDDGPINGIIRVIPPVVEVIFQDVTESVSVPSTIDLCESTEESSSQNDSPPGNNH